MAGRRCAGQVLARCATRSIATDSWTIVVQLIDATDQVPRHTSIHSRSSVSLSAVAAISMSLQRRGVGGPMTGTGWVLAQRPEWVGVGSDGSAFVQDKGNQSMMHLTATAQEHVAAYLEYDRIVGDADGGKLFTPEEYEAFKANAIAHRANRIYVCWRNMQTGMDCRSIGPSSPCFCGHRYKNHATDNHNKKIFCKQAGCACALYDYVPIRGTQDCKCTCKHSYDVHNVTGKRKCKQGGCACAGFHTSLSCSCRDQYGVHQTVFETREERQAAGRPVDNLAGGGQGYEALGGLTSFSSLVDGVDRMQIGPDGHTPQMVGAPPGWDAQQQRRIGPDATAASASSGAPPPQRKQLTQEDEFALYDAKYKKGGSAYSNVSRGSSLPSAMAARKAAAAAAAQGPPAGVPTRGRGQIDEGARAHDSFHAQQQQQQQHYQQQQPQQPQQHFSSAEAAPRGGRLGASSSSALAPGARRPAAASSAASSSAPRAATGGGRAPAGGSRGHADAEQLRDY